MTTLGRMSPADVRAAKKRRAVIAVYDLAAAFPVDHRAHVHAYYAHKRAVSAAACAAAVAAEMALIIAALRAEREAK